MTVQKSSKNIFHHNYERNKLILWWQKSMTLFFLWISVIHRGKSKRIFFFKVFHSLTQRVLFFMDVIKRKKVFLSHFIEHLNRLLNDCRRSSLRVALLINCPWKILFNSILCGRGKIDFSSFLFLIFSFGGLLNFNWTIEHYITI